MKKNFVVEYRYSGADEFSLGIFSKGRWSRWGSYKKKKDAENAIKDLQKNKKLPWEKKSMFEFRIICKKRGEI